MIGDRQSRAWRATILIVLVSCAGTVMLAWTSWADAASERTEAVGAHRVVARQVDELLRLRTEAALVEDRPMPGETIVEPIRSALGRLAIDPSVLTDLSTSPPVAIPDSPYSRHRIALTFSPLRIDQLARFLDAWRRDQPLWTISVISADRLTNQIAQPSSRAGEALDPRFTIRLTLENVHLTSATAPAREPS